MRVVLVNSRIPEHTNNHHLDGNGTSQHDAAGPNLCCLWHALSFVHLEHEAHNRIFRVSRRLPHYLESARCCAPNCKGKQARVCMCVHACVCMRVCMLVSLVQAHLTNQACLSLAHAQLTKLGFSWWWRGFWLRLKRHSLCKRTLFPLWKQTKKSADYSTCARTHARTHTRHHKAHQALQVRTASLMAATRKEYSVSFSRPDTVKSSAFPRNCGMNPE